MLPGTIAGSSVFVPFFSSSFLSSFVPFPFLSPCRVRERIGSNTGNKETAGRPVLSAASLPRDGLLKGTLNVRPLPLSFFPPRYFSRPGMQFARLPQDTEIFPVSLDFSTCGPVFLVVMTSLLRDHTFRKQRLLGPKTLPEPTLSKQYVPSLHACLLRHSSRFPMRLFWDDKNASRSFGVCPFWPWFHVGSLCQVLVWAEISFLLRWRRSFGFASGSLPCHASLVQGKINISHFLREWHPRGLGAAAVPALRICMNYFIWTLTLEGRSPLSQE